jgi:hypothetical protein
MIYFFIDSGFAQQTSPASARELAGGRKPEDSVLPP